MHGRHRTTKKYHTHHHQGSCPMPICQNQIQGLFKDFQGPYEGYIRRTKLKKAGTFISISRQIGPLKSSQGVWGSAVSSSSRVHGRAPAANAFLWHQSPGNASGDSNHMFGHGVLENLIQALSDTDSRTFKDHVCFQGLSRPWRAGKNSRTFKDPQEPRRCYLM